MSKLINDIITRNKEKSKLKIEFTDKPITAYGGLAILQKFFERLNLKEFLNKVLPVVEISNRKISMYDKLISFFSTVLIGGKCFSHLMFLGEQRVIREIFEIKKYVKETVAESTSEWDLTSCWLILTGIGMKYY